MDGNDGGPAQSGSDDRAFEIVSQCLHDNVVAMQSAWIEWKHGDGAEAAMQWIENTLDGPGLLPEENAPWSTDAQAWFDANQSKPFPACHCGRPSNILTAGEGFCSSECLRARAAQTGPAP